MLPRVGCSGYLVPGVAGSDSRELIGWGCGAWSPIQFIHFHSYICPYQVSRRYKRYIENQQLMQSWVSIFLNLMALKMARHTKGAQIPQLTYKWNTFPSPTAHLNTITVVENSWCKSFKVFICNISNLFALCFVSCFESLWEKQTKNVLDKFKDVSVITGDLYLKTLCCYSRYCWRRLARELCSHWL